MHVPSIFLRSFFFHPSTQEIANFAAHIFESSSWGLHQTLPLYLQFWDIFITFSLSVLIWPAPEPCLSLTSTLTAWSFTLRHSPTTLSSKNTPFSRTFQRPVHPLGFHIFYSTKKLSRACLASSPAVFLDVGKLRRMIIWSGSAVLCRWRPGVSAFFCLEWRIYLSCGRARDGETVE